MTALIQDTWGLTQRWLIHLRKDKMSLSLGILQPLILLTLVGPLLDDENVAGSYGMQVGPDEPRINPLEKGISLEHEIALDVASGDHAREESETG